MLHKPESPPPAGPLKLPRLAQVENEVKQKPWLAAMPGLVPVRERRALFTMHPIEVLPDRLAPALKTVPFPPGNAIQQVNALAVGKSRLWISATRLEDADFAGASPQTEQALQPIRLGHPRLFSCDLLSSQGACIPTGELATTSVHSVVSEGSRIWCASADRGVGQWDGVDGPVRWFGSSDGIPVRDVWQVAVGGDRVWGSQGAFGLWTAGFADLRWNETRVDRCGAETIFGGEVRRIACCDDWFCLAEGPLLLLDRPAQRWSRVDEQAQNDAPAGSIGRISCLAAEPSHGFWVGSQAGLHLLNIVNKTVRNWFAPLSSLLEDPSDARISGLVMSFPRRPSVRTDVLSPLRTSTSGTKLEMLARHRENWQQRRSRSKGRFNPFEPISRIPGEVTTVLSDGDFLLVGVAPRADAGTGQVLLYHKPAERWLGYFPVPSPPSCFASDATRLWIGLRGGKGGEPGPLLELTRATLYSSPLDHGRPDKIGPEEIAAKLAELPPIEQAIYAFAAGDYAKTVQILSQADPTARDLEILFLLGWSLDRLGLNQPDLAREYFSEILRRYPDNDFAADARQALQQLTTQHAH